ncbi:MAG: DUF1588 domain-containing protein [Proteobacteria bacterium]|nr:DUF1588 domain-containing protein [Pseudomonadota bacterium]MCP4919613.1 DUF1588 domain-containing protein [Pseudomonadota bacterium]
MIALILLACGTPGSVPAPLGATAGEPGLDEVCLDEATARLLRRLSHAEYTATVEDLVGVTPTVTLATDAEVHGLQNDAEALTVGGLLADQYRSSAEEVAWAMDLDATLPCDPWTLGQKACATVFAEDLGTRAFRRPITQDELDRYVAIWEQVAQDDGFEEGARWIVAALLQSPNFLYRPELGERGDDGLYRLTDWEIASELSYATWGTMPDAELLAAAEAGELHTAEQIAAQTDQLMADDRAIATTQQLVAIWLQLDRLDSVSRDGLEDADRATMREETDALVADAFDGPASGLLDAGLLTERSVLTVHALPDGSSPVHRGVLVRERLLCEELPPPPANLDTSPPETDTSLSTRERYAEHSENPECSGCHDRIDPIGFGFEHFDGVGARRDTENGHPVDASGALDDVPFDGVDELGDLLNDDPRYRACYLQTWRRHLTGTEACAEDPGELDVAEPMAAQTRRVAFTTREGTAEDTPARGTRLTLDDLPVDDIDYGAVSWELRSDDWGSGWCGYVNVTNESGDAVTDWQVDLDADGTVTNNWSSTLEDQGARWVFTPTEWATAIEPGKSTEFGFCATR